MNGQTDMPDMMTMDEKDIRFIIRYFTLPKGLRGRVRQYIESAHESQRCVEEERRAK